jgi:hypothetical protein
VPTWNASNARLRFAEIVDGAVAGEPQFVHRRDGSEVVIVSRDNFEKTRPTLKSFLLECACSGDGEAAFDAALQDIRIDGSYLLTRSSR